MNRDVSTEPASLHQVIRSTGLGSCYKAGCSAVIVGFSTAVIDAFRSSMPVSCSFGGPPSHSSPVVVFFSRGHPRSGNFHSTVPVDFGRLKSYENCLFERGSRSINLALFQCFKKKK